MKLDLSARSAGVIFEICTWDTKSEMRPRANHFFVAFLCIVFTQEINQKRKSKILGGEWQTNLSTLD